MCLDCGKWELVLSQCKPCSCSQSAGWSRGQTHCLHRGGGKVSMEETRRHSPLSLPCDVLSQQVPHSVYCSPPCIGLCTHHSSAASDIIIVLLLYLCSWGLLVNYMLIKVPKYCGGGTVYLKLVSWSQTNLNYFCLVRFS